MSWSKDVFGNNSTTFSYPVAGFDGAQAVEVAMTARTGGDAKWQPNDIPVTPGKTYAFSHVYKSTATTSIIIRYTSGTGAFTYEELVAKVPVSTEWKKDTYTFTAPSTAKSVTILHVLKKVGILTTDAYDVHDTFSSSTDSTPPNISIIRPVANIVASGTENFQSQASDTGGIAAVSFVIDGVKVGTDVLVAPYIQSIDTTTFTNGSHTVVSVARDISGNIATSSPVSFTVSNTITPPTDITAPNVTLITPVASGTVSGSVTITASSTDNLGVAGVTFYIDDMQIGDEATSSPYKVVWNTLLTPNGTHSIRAVAHDQAENTSTSIISIIVTNTITGTTTPTNLISNPSLEVIGVDGLPKDWFTNSWGSNDAKFTYVASSSESDGATSGDVSITNYTDGDAKWYFKDVPVSSTNGYAYSEYYNSSENTHVTVRYTMTNGSFTYIDLPEAPAVLGWTKYSAVINPPVGAVSLTVFHHLDSIGFLDVDSFSLIKNSSEGEAFAQGMVSLTFDDGWLSQYVNALPILQAAHMKGVFAIISDEATQAVSGNIISNPSFEATSSMNTPVDWTFTASGENNGTQTFLTEGHTGAHAVRATITNYSNGEAGWHFKDSSILPDQDYTYTLYYTSDADIVLSARYLLRDNSYSTEELDTIPAQSSWTNYTRVFHVPSDAVSVTLFNNLRTTGTFTLDDTSLERVQIYVDPSQILAMQAEGSEIASHTRTHTSLSTTTLSAVSLQDEVGNSKANLIAMGAHPVSTLVYPYGDYNTNIIQAVKNAGYIGARSVDRGFNTKATEKYALAIQQVDIGTTVDQIRAWIDVALKNKTWLILMYHQIDSLGAELSATPTDLQAVVNYLQEKNADVITLSEGINQMSH